MQKIVYNLDNRTRDVITYQEPPHHTSCLANYEQPSVLYGRMSCIRSRSRRTVAIRICNQITTIKINNKISDAA
ncbi:hypothetical protein HanIR_Chr17g0894681 [Helianthus annuus]|nr:hypothetical protein HanIR_Chr17g0894681 [Helianthus annuus]